MTVDVCAGETVLLLFTSLCAYGHNQILWSALKRQVCIDYNTLIFGFVITWQLWFAFLQICMKDFDCKWSKRVQTSRILNSPLCVFLASRNSPSSPLPVPSKLNTTRWFWRRTPRRPGGTRGLSLSVSSHLGIQRETVTKHHPWTDVSSQQKTSKHNHL